MPKTLAIILLILFTLPATANEREVLFGTWGTPKQCARELIVEGGTVLAEPFVIKDQWMQQGKLWCRLSWFPIDKRKDGIFTGAMAQCGEDSVRSYLLRMETIGDALTIHWNYQHKNGPLRRCPTS